MILFESSQTYRVEEYSFVDQSLLLHCLTGPNEERMDLLFWHLLYYEIITDDLVGITVERLEGYELEALAVKTKIDTVDSDHWYIAISSGQQRWYVSALEMRMAHHITSVSECMELLWQVPPSDTQQTADALAAANSIPENCFWWASDYEEEPDVLILHALQAPWHKHYAQLYLYKPQYMSRPGLLDKVEFHLGPPEGLSLPANLLTDTSQIITLRPKSLPFSHEPLPTDPSQDFVVACQAVRYISPMGFLHDLFNRNQNIIWLAARNKGTMVDIAPVLKQFDGADLHWRSISSQLSSEMVLTVTGCDVADYLVFMTPYYVDIPKEMHNVRVRPPTSDDWVRIKQRMGQRLEIIQKFTRNYGDDYVVVIDCDEGWFFMYTEGAGTYSQPEPTERG